MRIASLSAVAVMAVLTGSISESVSQIPPSASGTASSASSWLTQIITIAEEERSGRAISVSPQKHRPYRYEVRFAGADHQDVTIVEIDVKKNRAISTRKPGLLEKLLGYGKSDVRLALLSKLTLAEAIRSAEQKIPGRAFKAAFRNQNGHAAYEIDVAHDGHEERITVDATSGRIDSST